MLLGVCDLLTDTRELIVTQFVANFTVTVKGALGVFTHLITAAIVHLTLIDVYSIQKEWLFKYMLDNNIFALINGTYIVM